MDPRRVVVAEVADRLLDAAAILVECGPTLRLALGDTEGDWARRVARTIGKRSEAIRPKEEAPPLDQRDAA